MERKLKRRLDSEGADINKAAIKIGDIAGAIGKGLVAGLIGTAAITASTMIEMKIRGRKQSSAPADAAGKVLGVQPKGEEEKTRFSNLVHWGYGAMWGIARGLLGATSLNSPAATAAHFGAVWGAALVMLPALDVSPPVTKWGAKEIAIDAMHHLIYAAAVGLAYNFLDKGGLYESEADT
jgi:hypothetical protein